MKQVINYLRYKKALQKYVYIRGVCFTFRGVVTREYVLERCVY